MGEVQMQEVNFRTDINWRNPGLDGIDGELVPEGTLEALFIMLVAELEFCIEFKTGFEQRKPERMSEALLGLVSMFESIRELKHPIFMKGSNLLGAWVLNLSRNGVNSIFYDLVDPDCSRIEVFRRRCMIQVDRQGESLRKLFTKSLSGDPGKGLISRLKAYVFNQEFAGTINLMSRFVIRSEKD